MSDELSADARAAQPRTTEELLERCAAAWAELTRPLAALDEARMTAPGADGWTVKDHLVHITAWEKMLLGALGGSDPFAAMGVDLEQLGSREIDRINQAVYEANRDRPLDEVLADFQATHEQAMTALARLDTADLHRPYAHFQPNDPRNRQEPIMNWIVGNSYEHYEEHIPWMRSLLGGA